MSDAELTEVDWMRLIESIQEDEEVFSNFVGVAEGSSAYELQDWLLESCWELRRESDQCNAEFAADAFRDMLDDPLGKLEGMGVTK